MLHEYYTIPIEDHQLSLASVNLTNLPIIDAEARKTSSSTMKTKSTDFVEARVGQANTHDLATVVVVPNSIKGTASSKSLHDVFDETTDARPSTATVESSKCPRVIIEPKTAMSARVASASQTLTKQEFTEARAFDMFTLPVQPENDEDSESESDETDIELSDDDIGVQDEFKDKVEAVVQGFGNPYDPSNEAAPNLPAYHPSFLNVEKLCAELLEESAQMLKNAEYKDAKLSDIQEQATAKQTVHCPKPRRIGMVGDSGVGKSSLINSLLDTPELAIQGEDGGACTCVITEFHQAWPTQNAPFKAEIELFEPEQIKSILTNHFQSYFKCHTQPTKGLDKEALEELEGHANTAFDAFQALFADHREFRTEASGHEFLSRAKLISDSAIPHKLYTWVEQLKSKYEADQGMIHMVADTELGLKMEPFVKMSSSVADEENPRPSPWPIVKLARVGFQSPLLKRGLIIADLPGKFIYACGLIMNNLIGRFVKGFLISTTRTKSTSQYIRCCDYVILIAPIVRVLTDDNVHKRLVHFSRTFGPRKTLLCTKIDDMPSNARPTNLAPTTEALEYHSRLSRAHTLASTEKTKLTKSLKGVKGKTKKDTQKQIQKIGRRRKVLGALLHDALITMRSQKVSVAMRKKYKSGTSDIHTLNIMCVSNQDYSMHKDGYDEEDIPMPIDSTGIPSLRFKLSALPADIRLDVLRQYVKGTVPELISSLDVWSHRSTNHRRLELREVVDKPRKAIAEVIAGYIEGLKSELETCILERIRSSCPTWIQHGTQMYEQWETWHLATLNAWIRNNGSHKTKAKGFHDWNSELIEPVAEEMSDIWWSYDHAIEEASEKCYTSLSALLEGIRETLKRILSCVKSVEWKVMLNINTGMPGVAIMPMVPFLKSLAPKKVKLQSLVEDFSKEILVVSNNTRLNVITDDDDSYIMQVLLPLYTRCNEKVGKNISIVKRALLEQAIRDGAPYSKLCDQVKDAVELALLDQQATLLQNVQDIFDTVVRDFDQMFVVEEIPDARRDTLCKQIQEFVMQANARLNGPIEREFAAATSLSAP